jgi:secondary thiamine-phosphate synthase enzyme
MNIYDKVYRLTTNRRSEMIDITSQVQQFIREKDIKTGKVVIFCPHTTAAITINENADPDVQHDILLTLDELLPQNRAGYRHNENNSDSHMKSSLIGASETVLIKDGSLVLGTWQGIYFCEFDGPRTRQFITTIEAN